MQEIEEEKVVGKSSGRVDRQSSTLELPKKINNAREEVQVKQKDLKIEETMWNY